MLLRRLLRPAVRTREAGRRYFESDVIVHKDELSGSKRWMLLSFFISAPAVTVAIINAFFTEPEDHSPPEYVPYPHLRIRTKAFPWGNGDRTMLHNPQTNATTQGLEEEFVHHH